MKKNDKLFLPLLCLGLLIIPLEYKHFEDSGIHVLGRGDNIKG